MDEDFINKLYGHLQKKEYNLFAFHVAEEIFKPTDLAARRAYHMPHLPDQIAKMTENRYKETLPNVGAVLLDTKSLITFQHKVLRATPDKDITYSPDNGS